MTDEELARRLSDEFGQELMYATAKHVEEWIISIADRSGSPVDFVMMFVADQLLVDSLMSLCVASGLDKKKSEAVIREAREFLATRLDRCAVDPRSN